METPAKVKAAAQWLIDQYGGAVEPLGKHEGADAYYYRFPDDVDAGFPTVYLLKNDEVTEITGFEALRIVSRNLKD